MKRLLIALAGLALFAASCTSPAVDDNALPDTDLELLGGGSYDLRDAAGPRALNLWATWCTPCLAELPAFDDVAARASGVNIVGINTGDTGADATELVDRLGLMFPQALDPTATVQAALRITGLPATVFLDESGDIVQVHNGELETDELEALLTELFGTAFGR